MDTNTREASVGLLQAVTDLAGSIGHLAKAATVKNQEEMDVAIGLLDQAVEHLREVIAVLERKN